MVHSLPVWEPTTTIRLPLAGALNFVGIVAGPTNSRTPSTSRGTHSRSDLATGGCDYLAAAFETIQKLQNAGVPVLAGTDSPVPSSPHGVGMLGELELLVESGQSPVESLSAGTSLPAEIFGLDDRGRLRVGMRADILLVDGNPTKTITDLRRIERIWKNGYEVDRSP